MQISKPEPRHRGPNLRLFAHIKDEELKRATISAWEGSADLFDKTLKKVIEDKIETSYAAIDNEDIYNLQDRVGYLADQCGYRRAMKEILGLLPTNN